VKDWFSGIRCLAVHACRFVCGHHWSCVALLISFGAGFGAVGFGYAQATAPNTVASGTKLYLRLETAVSTESSHLNQAVSAHAVREVTSSQGVLVPLGAEVTGSIAKLIPTSDPTDHARMLIVFNQLTIAGHPAAKLAAHFAEVENARETVLADGTIQGVLEKDAAVGRMDGLLDKLGSPGSTMERMSGKTLGKPDTAIEYPVGTDFVLVLDQPLTVDSTSPPAVAGEISKPASAALQAMLAEAPSRVQSKTKKPGDPLNLVIVGSADQILNAFKTAGWGAAKKLGTHSAVDTVRAMASDEGYEAAPVSELYLFGRVEDFAFEKTLNTFWKRHHLRLWRITTTTADGRQVWLGASTHDIGLDIHPGVISHEIDTDLDAERAKVGADLAAAGAVSAEQLVTRPNPLSTGKTATGGTWTTDGKMLAIELKTNP
jgi:hypothetical protein